jgi:mannose-1-phosphate guanylyltransferase
VSTPERPKQLLPLASSVPLIRETVERARSLGAGERIRILAGDHLAGPFRRELPELTDDAYLVEPEARGTCPVLAWAAWEIHRLDPDAVIVSLHADHLIRPVEAFVDTVHAAAELAAREELLLTVGVRPDRVETGYGHIQPGEELDAPGEAVAFRVAAFHEKPDRPTARRYTDRGFLWNTGIFVWKASVFLDQVRRHAPEVARCLPLLEEDGPEAFFDAVPVCVVDRAVMERSERVACVQATFDWDDVGNWASLARTRAGDEHGNVLEGQARVVDGSGNVAWADQGRLVLWGVDDMVVVRTGEVTLVMPLGRAPALKELLARLEDDA